MNGSSTALAAMGTVFAIICGIAGVLYMAKQSGREAAKERRQELADAATTAVAAERAYWSGRYEDIKRELTEMTDDRNYWRSAKRGES